MKYYLFLNHPKGEEVYKVSKEREEILREYFKRIDTLEVEVIIRGESKRAIVDYSAFSNLANFDCFNCNDPCCADNPIIYEKETRNFIKNNLKEYNELTRNLDILLEEGYSSENIIKSLENDFAMVPDETVEEEISLCTCSYKKDNKTTLCSLHKICIDKNLEIEDIVKVKPIVCSLWPIDIISEDDESLLYITVPDDFTTGFTIEDYYDTPCINKELSKSSKFRRKNPEGFKEEEYYPIIISYKETLKYSLGEKFYKKVLERLIEESLVFKEEVDLEEKQILKK